MVGDAEVIVRRPQRARVEHRLVRAVGDVAKPLHGQLILVGDIAAIFGVLGDEQIGLAQAATFQLEDQLARVGVGGRQSALLGHQMQRHEDVERRRLAATMGQPAAEEGVELAGIADEHHVVFGRLPVFVQQLAIRADQPPPEGGVAPAAAGLRHAVFDALPQRRVTNVHRDIGLGLQPLEDDLIARVSRAIGAEVAHAQGVFG